MLNAEQISRKAGLEDRKRWSLANKVKHAERIIRSWVEANQEMVQVNVSGKDSWVVASLVQNLYPDVPTVFVNTGMEFPEVTQFNTQHASLVLRPALSFADVVRKHGWPMLGKNHAQWIREARNTNSDLLRRKRCEGINRDGSMSQYHISKKWLKLVDGPFEISEKCCHCLKTGPLMDNQKATGRLPFIGTRTAESHNRQTQWILHGCNIVGSRSMPIALWSDADVWEYIKAHGIDLPSVYEMGYTRTGCMLCGFGAHLEKEPNRFQMLAVTHPKIWEWGMHTLGMAEVLEFCGIKYRPVKRLI